MQEEIYKVKNHYGGDYKYKSNTGFPGFELDLNSEPILQMIECFKMAGLESKPLKYNGGSDANILNNRGILAIDLGIGAKNPHSIDEFIKIKDMEIVSNIMLHFLTSINKSI